MAKSKILFAARGPFNTVVERTGTIQTGRVLGKNLAEAKKKAKAEGFDELAITTGNQRPRTQFIALKKGK